ncbi:MAG: HEAT repeat domain-containing protein [Euryarchaeota archaeon]|nr:HEAT repeat domain-containing protein [Euryarchaeota archaeon]
MTPGTLRPAHSEFGTVDPPPALSRQTVELLRRRLLDGKLSLFEKYRAIFGLRNLNTPESAVALGEAMLVDASAVLRHECAYVLGQMQQPASLPYLEKGLRFDGHVMVRHECAEALGALGGEKAEALLRQALEEDAAVEVRESCELALQHLDYLRDSGRLDL